MAEQPTQRSAGRSGPPGFERSRAGQASGAAAALQAAAASDFEDAVRFAWAQRESMSRSRVPAPLIGDRPVPPLRPDRSWMLTLVLALGSVAAHGAALTLFDSKPVPRPSVGLEAISVELVLGANAAAGITALPHPSQETVNATPLPDEGPDLSRSQVAAAVAAVETQRDEPMPPSEASIDREPAPVEALLPAPTAEARAAAPPTPRPRPVARPKADTPAKPDAGLREAALRTAPESDADRRSRQVLASSVSSGAGIGRSDADPEYRGVVAAHLARYKQFPDEARRVGVQGNATVTFGLDAEGRVVSVELVNGAGHPSLDREARAMVHRASPFPPPPGGQAVNFTVPVAFNLR